MIERPNMPRPIIVKKVYQVNHGGHHGGAWKVAYADFVTAMMAFFLLMWLLGATTEKQRKALADYFSPTLVQKKEESAGSNGMFGGASRTGHPRREPARSPFQRMPRAVPSQRLQKPMMRRGSRR